ncbi:MAG: nucleotidyltransferase family protein [Bacteroidota bacterium]
MKTINEILSLLATHKQDFTQKYNVKTLAVFGSYSRGEQHDKSDIDILVEFTEPIGFEFVDFADELESLLQTKVDLVTRKAIKPRYWNYIEKDVQYV